MDARAITVRTLLMAPDANGSDRSVQLRVPVFQRAYEWRRDAVSRLLDDVLARLEAPDHAAPHFLGSIVLLDEPEDASRPDAAMIIDGQQRLLTLALAIARCERRMGDVPSVLANAGCDAVDRPRLVAADVDDPDFRAVLDGRDPVAPRPLRDAVAEIDTVLANQDPAAVRAAILDRIQLVRILLDRQEDAEAVFESLNTTGQPLTQADLVRTALLAGFGTVEKQRKMDALYWRPADDRLRAVVPDRRSRERQSPKDRITGDYLRAFLMRNGGRVEPGRVFRTFIDQYDRTPEGAGEFLALFDALSHAYVELHPGPAATPGAITPHHVMARLGYTVHHPLLLQLAERSRGKDASFTAADLSLVAAGIESFFIRRAVVGWPTNSLGRLFEGLCSGGPADCAAVWKGLGADWPSDARFVRALREAPVYQDASAAAWIMLARLDVVEDAKDSAMDADASLEHVLPQTLGKNANGDAWRSMLGADWESVHARRLHTLANLSLTRRNAEMSNGSFEKKRAWLSGSKFAGTRRIGALERWDEAAIAARADRLATAAVRLWPLPDGIEGV